MAEATEGSDDRPINSTMDTHPTNTNTNSSEPQEPPVLFSGPASPWFQSRWRLEIRLANDTNHAFDAGKAYHNFVSTALQAFPNAIHFCTNDGSMYFTEQSQMPSPTDYHNYFQGARSSRPEHGAYRFYMVLAVQTYGLPIQDMKHNKQFLEFLHSTVTWLTYHNLDSLDIQSAGFFTLRHPHWTFLEGFHFRAKNALKDYLQDLDMGTLSPDQVAAVRPYKDRHYPLPPFDLCIQNVRAYYSRSSQQNDSNATGKPQAKFISAEALEFRCARAHIDLFTCLLDGVTSRDIWSLGRFASYQLRRDSADHFRACVSEQNTFLQSTSYILLQNVDRIVLDGMISVDHLNNIPGFEDAMHSIPLRGLLLTLNGSDTDDLKTRPDFLPWNRKLAMVRGSFCAQAHTCRLTANGLTITFSVCIPVSRRMPLYQATLRLASRSEEPSDQIATPVLLRWKQLDSIWTYRKATIAPRNENQPSKS